MYIYIQHKYKTSIMHTAIYVCSNVATSKPKTSTGGSCIPVIPQREKFKAQSMIKNV